MFWSGMVSFLCGPSNSMLNLLPDEFLLRSNR